MSNSRLTSWVFKNELNGKNLEVDSQSIYNLCLEQFSSILNWYEDHKEKKKEISKSLRAAAVVLALFGGIAPIVAALFRDEQSLHRALYTMEGGYLCLALAGGMVLFDRIFGFSSGWMRYMSAILALQAIIAKFSIDWARIQNENRDTIDQRDMHFNLAENFQKELRAVVANETQEWSIEFRTSLTSIERLVKNASNH